MARRDGEFEAIEEELVEAMRLLARLPDRERGFLSSGARSMWPAIVRDPVTDYKDDVAPRRSLSRRDMTLLDRVFLGERCLAGVVPMARRQLVGVVLAMKARPDRGGYRWERVWERLGGKRCGATTDGLRSRYETQVRRMAAADGDDAAWERMRSAVLAEEAAAIMEVE